MHQAIIMVTEFADHLDLIPDVIFADRFDDII